LGQRTTTVRISKQLCNILGKLVPIKGARKGRLTDTAIEHEYIIVDTKEMALSMRFLMSHQCSSGAADVDDVEVIDVTENNVGGYFRRYKCICPGCGASVEFQNSRKGTGPNGHHADVNLRRMNAAFSVGLNTHKTIMYDALSGIKPFHKSSILESRKNILKPLLREFADEKLEEQQQLAVNASKQRGKKEISMMIDGKPTVVPQVDISIDAVAAT
jgi:hypothetical protein